jgi:uncharacterized protein with PIN domain
VSLYLDASAIVPMLVEEDSSRALADYLAAADDAFVVSAFTAAEVTSVCGVTVWPEAGRRWDLARQDRR